jgi:hypothetical protein
LENLRHKQSRTLYICHVTRKFDVCTYCRLSNRSDF